MNQNENYQNQIWSAIHEWIEYSFSILSCLENLRNADQITIAKKEGRCSEFLRMEKLHTIK